MRGSESWTLGRLQAFELLGAARKPVVGLKEHRKSRSGVIRGREGRGRRRVEGRCLPVSPTAGSGSRPPQAPSHSPPAGLWPPPA